MKKLINKSVVAVASLATILCAQNANASLVGDTIDWEFNPVGFANESGSALVDANNPEAAAGPSDIFELDVHDESFDLTYDLTRFTDVGVATIWTLSDLDWVGAPGVITNVTQSEGPDVSDISFGFDWIIVTVPNLQNPPAIHTMSFDIETHHYGDPVPDAGASALFLGMGLIPLFGAATRKRK